MSKAALTVAFFFLATCCPHAYGQSRAEAAVFLDYLAISQTSTDNLGLGARFGYRIHRHLMLEGEFAWGYGVNFEEAYRNISNGSITAIEQTSIGVTDGLLGPMLQPSRGRLRPFVTMKAGFLDFRLSPSLLPEGGVVSSVLGLRASTLNTALYPGGGAEAVLGPLGLRLDLGDLIYFNNGGHNNLSISFGPVLRF